MDEFDASPIIETIWQAKKHCYLPILSENDKNPLIFSRYNSGDRLHANRYSILEPVNISCNNILPENLDIVITPLVAFDLHGHRLGAGGGYYDRTFAFLQAHPRERPCMIGLAYASQQADSLPTDPWDIPLHFVLTEKEFITITSTV